MAERWDCVVVGSGFGGSVAALRLSEKGYRVLVVEMGKRWRPADNLYFYHDDHLGTPQAMTDATGTTIWQAQYYPFGAVYQLPVALVENNLRFPGQYWDAETGIAQNYFRDYDESTGTYREADPMGIAGNRFSVFLYSSNNPRLAVLWVLARGSWLAYSSQQIRSPSGGV